MEREKTPNSLFVPPSDPSWQEKTWKKGQYSGFPQLLGHGLVLKHYRNLRKSILWILALQTSYYSFIVIYLYVSIVKNFRNFQNQNSLLNSKCHNLIALVLLDLILSFRFLLSSAVSLYRSASSLF